MTQLLQSLVRAVGNETPLIPIKASYPLGLGSINSSRTQSKNSLIFYLNYLPFLCIIQFGKFSRLIPFFASRKIHSRTTKHNFFPRFFVPKPFNLSYLESLLPRNTLEKVKYLFSVQHAVTMLEAI